MFFAKLPALKMARGSSDAHLYINPHRPSVDSRKLRYGMDYK